MTGPRPLRPVKPSPTLRTWMCRTRDAAERFVRGYPEGWLAIAVVVLGLLTVALAMVWLAIDWLWNAAWA